MMKHLFQNRIWRKSIGGNADEDLLQQCRSLTLWRQWLLKFVSLGTMSSLCHLPETWNWFYFWLKLDIKEAGFNFPTVFCAFATVYSQDLIQSNTVISTGPDTVCEARAASVFWNHPGSRSIPGIRTLSAAIRCVLQPSRWRHRVRRRPMPSIRWWHSDPPSEAGRQQSCRSVHSRRLYHRRQAVV